MPLSLKFPVAAPVPSLPRMAISLCSMVVLQLLATLPGAAALRFLDSEERLSPPLPAGDISNAEIDWTDTIDGTVLTVMFVVTILLFLGLCGWCLVWWNFCSRWQFFSDLSEEDISPSFSFLFSALFSGAFFGMVTFWCIKYLGETAPDGVIPSFFIFSFVLLFFAAYGTTVRVPPPANRETSAYEEPIEKPVIVLFVCSAAGYGLLAALACRHYDFDLGQLFDSGNPGLLFCIWMFVIAPVVASFSGFFLWMARRMIGVLCNKCTCC